VRVAVIKGKGQASGVRGDTDRRASTSRVRSEASNSVTLLTWRPAPSSAK